MQTPIPSPTEQKAKINPLRRYLVFAFRHGLAGGGWDDYVGTADTLEDAVIMARCEREHWWFGGSNVVDLAEGREIPEYDWPELLKIEKKMHNPLTKHAKNNIKTSNPKKPRDKWVQHEGKWMKESQVPKEQPK